MHSNQTIIESEPQYNKALFRHLAAFFTLLKKTVKVLGNYILSK